MTAKHDRLLIALLSAPSIEVAAKSAGISEATALRYMKEPDFIVAYRDARREVVSQSLTQLQNACTVAVATLREIASDGEAPASSRVSAAKAILETSVRAVEIDDLAARVEAMEAVLKEQQTNGT